MLIKKCQMKISVGKVVQKGGGYKNDMIMPIFYMFWNYREKEIMGRGTWFYFKLKYELDLKGIIEGIVLNEFLVLVYCLKLLLCNLI